MENDPYEEERKSQIHEFLVCAYEIQCFENDKECRKAKLEGFCIKKIDDEFPLSSIFFPAITKIHTAGSRAEKLWIPSSDKDTVYEIGPGLVSQKLPPGSQIDNEFFWEEAGHSGYYRVSDSKGGYIYPQDLQMKLAPTFQYLNKLSNRSNQDHLQMESPFFESSMPIYYNRYPQAKGGYDANEEKTNAAVKLDDDDDHVIGLKLDKWPDSVQQQFESKLKSAPFYLREIFGKECYKLRIYQLNRILSSL